MTLPHERFRAIRWGRELLVVIQADTTMNDDVKAVANEVLSDYPQEGALAQRLAAAGGALPSSWVLSIDAAGRLFRRLLQTHEGDQHTRRLLMFTSRHFPSAGEALQRGGDFDLLWGAWLKPDRYEVRSGLPELGQIS